MQLNTPVEEEVFFNLLNTRTIGETVKLKQVSGGFRLLIPTEPKGVHIRYFTDEEIMGLFRDFSPILFEIEGEVHAC